MSWCSTRGMLIIPAKRGRALSASYRSLCRKMPMFLSVFYLQLARGGAEALDAAQLDLLVAANHVRQLRELYGALVGGRPEVVQGLLDQAAVFADQRALDAPHMGVAEDVQGRAAQPPQRD